MTEAGSASLPMRDGLRARAGKQGQEIRKRDIRAVFGDEAIDTEAAEPRALQAFDLQVRSAGFATPVEGMSALHRISIAPGGIRGK